MLGNADRLSRLSTEAYAALYEGEHAALASLGDGLEARRDLAALDPRFAPYLDQTRRRSSRSSKTSRYFLRSYRGRSRRVARSAAGRRRPAGRARAAEAEVRTVARRRARAARRAAGRTGGARRERRARRARSSRRSADARAAFLDARRRSCRRRRQAAARHARARARSGLRELAMPHVPRRRARDARIDRARSVDARAASTASEFFLSPNPGRRTSAARAHRVGRRALARHARASHAGRRPDEPGRTLIFDEVDAGIGGAAADAVGARLQALARRYQVLCITHLPQIAARADAHFQIAKHVRGGTDHDRRDAGSTTPAREAGNGADDCRRRRLGRRFWRRRASCSRATKSESESKTRKTKVAVRGESERATAWRVSTSSRRSAAR